MYKKINDDYKKYMFYNQGAYYDTETSIVELSITGANISLYDKYIFVNNIQENGGANRELLYYYAINLETNENATYKEILASVNMSEEEFKSKGINAIKKFLDEEREEMEIEECDGEENCNLVKEYTEATTKAIADFNSAKDYKLYIDNEFNDLYLITKAYTPYGEIDKGNYFAVRIK